MININKHKETFIELTSPKNKKYKMSEYEVSRWFSLIEAVDIIDTKAKQMGVRGDAVNWVKPIAIQKYIDERTESMLFEIQDDLSKEKRCTTSPEQE
jgi:hypothetical protein